MAYVAWAALALALGSRWGLPRGALLVLVGVPLGLAEVVLRHLVQKQLQSFERELAVAIQRRDHRAMLPLLRAQRLLRFAAPRHQLLAKLGLIHRRLDRPLAAARILRVAYDEAPRQEAPAIAQKLADAYYAAERYAEAERFYRAAYDPGQPINPGLAARLARLIVERDGAVAEAELLLRQAVDAAFGRAGVGALRCQLVRVLVRTGKLEEAIWQLQLAEEELKDPSADDQLALGTAREAVAAARAVGHTG
jgi:tetratricopeptide (TPR) repeat protein